MSTLSTKIDFAVIFEVKNANPNGDPLNGNRPRINYDGLGEVSDVCLKRKIRDRLQEAGEAIFVQSDDRRRDEYKSLRSRAEAVLGKKIDAASVALACKTWIDFRSFGQILAFKGKDKNKPKKDADDQSSKANDKETGVSIPIRGPVSIHSAYSIEPVGISSMQITKSVNTEDSEKRGSDTMGMKHRIDKSTVYVFFGAMNPQLAERTGFSDEDAQKIKNVLPKLFENDASSARPEGSMAIKTVLWWKHNCKAGQYSSAKVHRSLRYNADGTFTPLTDLPGLQPEIIHGF
jgi:CRISPR-associated protein Csd2